MCGWLPDGFYARIGGDNSVGGEYGNAKPAGGGDEDAVEGVAVNEGKLGGFAEEGGIKST